MISKILSRVINDVTIFKIQNFSIWILCMYCIIQSVLDTYNGEQVNIDNVGAFLSNNYFQTYILLSILIHIRNGK